ncbi:hypothetical protein B0J11DRAFT_315844 [Dendryphion nanum]|uniref:C2H2-type domain-containing protein n=1 Tax=Dendryphion nanum TaxID=256645 RepID=A0A9P9IKF9_9PLEO|nr:hypothetical protein B0J11DRAFT_315844 [Dendryphion nanum]
MRTWLHSHRIKKQRSEPLLSATENDEHELVTEIKTERPPPLQLHDAARIAASKTSSRISIERYLSAPIEDEPATVPAIEAALHRHKSKKSLRAVAQVSTQGRPYQHSRESSWDANSDGKKTFYTSGSAPESSGTSYSAVSKPHRPAAGHQRKISLSDVPEVPKTEAKDADIGRAISPEWPSTVNGVYNMEKSWTEQKARQWPNYKPDTNIDYRAKAQTEIARIEEKARELEKEMSRFKLEIDPSPFPPPLRTTGPSAYNQSASQTQIAWIRGGERSEFHQIDRPQSNGSALTGITYIPDRPTTSHDNRIIVAPLTSHPRATRRSKSTTSLSSRAHPSSTTSPTPPTPKRPKWHCTFCPTPLPSLSAWLSHENQHLPPPLYICCPRTGSFPATCPFCPKSSPSPSHLADHAYLSCQAKPLAERTYTQEDAFLQHVSQTHKPSMKGKAVRMDELLETWKQPGMVGEVDRFLTCGFCGKKCKSVEERMEHVGKHFEAGWDMRGWWVGRRNHEVPHPKPSESLGRNIYISHRCKYCQREFANLPEAQKRHPICTMYSCSFLPGMHNTIYTPASSPSHSPSPHCAFCTTPLALHPSTLKLSPTTVKSHLTTHAFRSCNQRLYFSGQRFRQHLQDSHKASFDLTLFAGWPVLLRACKKDKPSIFEPVEDEVFGLRRAHTEPELDRELKRYRERGQKDIPQTPQSQPQPQSHDTPKAAPSNKMNFMDLDTIDSPTLSTPPPRKRLRRKASMQSIPDRTPSHSSAKREREREKRREIRESTQFFVRGETLDPPPYTPSQDMRFQRQTAGEMQRKMDEPPASPTHSEIPSSAPSPSPNRKHRIASLPTSIFPSSPSIPTFYRRRVDASMRNRVYVRDEAVSGPLGKGSSRMFRKVGEGGGIASGSWGEKGTGNGNGAGGGVFGSLVLHSSLVGAVAGARMTNGVDVYGVH